MRYKIIVDSCCDLTPQLKEKMEILSVPLSMRLGNREYVDDDSLDINEFRNDMKACTEKTGSASPAPYVYQSAMESATDSFVVTLSSQLSGSHQNAVLAKKCVEENKTANAHVFDSKSASAGETLIALKIYELILQDLPKENIILKISTFIDQMKTYFVLENYDNLQKNGRLNKITGTLASILGIKLVMGSDGDGNIALYAKPRGTNQMIERLLSLIKESGKNTDDENIVISHCNNPHLAERLATAVRERFNFKEIFIIPTGGLSSLYTDDKGIVIAF